MMRSILPAIALLTLPFPALADGEQDRHHSPYLSVPFHENTGFVAFSKNSATLPIGQTPFAPTSGFSSVGSMPKNGTIRGENPQSRISNRKLQDSTCPGDLEVLVEQMLSDLPAYANRTIARSRSAVDRPISTYVMLAGEAEFDPVATEAPQVDPPDIDNTAGNAHQVFFTTWERSFRETGISDSQTYHWLFLVETESGWRLDMMFSRSSAYPTPGPVTPPRESSQGIIGRSVQLWLRDCRARSR